jgi:chemotaxis protein methyltransferase CheR
MSTRDFTLFRDFIYDQCGINLAPVKRTMLTGRLTKRMRSLSMTSFKRYFDYVTSSEGRRRELVHMIDVVTTNKTEFFRESGHFDYLQDQVLPMLSQGRPSLFSKVHVWSAGCSSGEEPYTLAMVLDAFFSKAGRGDFSVLATDISTRVLEQARKGIYPESCIERVPLGFKKAYLMRGRGSRAGFCRVVPEIRKKLDFRRLNLNEGRDFEMKRPMDVIFCRNVIIYFDQEIQSRLFDKFFNQLRPGGYLFIGHSETLHGISDRFSQVGVSVYRKPE